MTAARIFLASLLATSLLALTGCGARGTESSSQPAPTQAAADIQLGAEMTGKLKWAQVTEQRVARPLSVAGKVQVNEERTARVLAPAAGHITDWRVRTGDPVQKDQVLFALRSREVPQVVTEYLESRRELELSEKTLTMTKDLFEHQAASRISLQQAENEVGKGQARVARAKEALRIFGLDSEKAEIGAPGSAIDAPILVRSPIAGTVMERPATLGQYVQPESGPLITIADLSTVWVLAEVFERDIRFVRNGLRAEVTATAYPDQRFTARVARIHDVVDAGTRTIKVRFLVENPHGRLKPEMFASVLLFLSDSERRLAVPASAVFTDGGQSYVYVRDNRNSVSRRRIETGGDSGGLVQVTAGLRAGETVVSEGTLLVRRMEQQSREP